MERLIDDCIIMDYGKILVQKPVGELLRTFRRYTFTLDSADEIPENSALFHTSVIRKQAETWSFESLEFVSGWLKQNGIQAVVTEEPPLSLEDAFIGLTGKY